LVELVELVKQQKEQVAKLKGPGARTQSAASRLRSFGAPLGKKSILTESEN